MSRSRPSNPCTVIEAPAWCSCMRPPGLRAMSTTRIPGCLAMVGAAWLAERYASVLRNAASSPKRSISINGSVT